MTDSFHAEWGNGEGLEKAPLPRVIARTRQAKPKLEILLQMHISSHNPFVLAAATDDDVDF
jgi:hypothetical protein